MSFDVAVIGSGPGGYVAAVRCAQLGLKTACVDSRETYGGTCLNVGCIPSKALLQSTEHFAFIKHHAKEHGISVQNLNFDFKKMMDRKKFIVDGLTSGVGHLFDNYHIQGFHGEAAFEDPHHLKVKDQRIEAAHIIIATGSEPVSLPFLQIDEKKILSSTGALALTEVPKKLLVIGGGVIGVELASVYNRLGSEVVVIEMLDQICAGMDQTLTKQYLQVLKKQGITFYLSARVMKAEGTTLIIQYEGAEVKVAGDVVLVAVGRRPNTRNLGLGTIGLETNDKGFIPVDEHFRTKIPHIFAIGDVIEGPMLAHKASEEGIAVAELLGGHHYPINYMTIPNIIYTQPELAALGYTEQEARQLGLKVLSGVCYFKGNPRARCSGETEGCVKVIGEANSHRLIGMHILGSHASEMIGEGVIAIRNKGTLEDIAFAPHGHPTFSEAIKEAALKALDRAIHI